MVIMGRAKNQTETAIEKVRFWEKQSGTALKLGAVMLAVSSFSTIASDAQTTKYSIGEPTAEEQLSLELINRARMNPAAEGEILAQEAGASPSSGESRVAETIVSAYSDVDSFNTKLNTMKSEMAALAPVPPLAFNANLISAARLHNQNMLASNEQTHYSSGSSKNYQQRMDASGYIWSESGENIFASALNVIEAHASFEIDWGIGPSGMQDPRGHRVAIHSDAFREIGIGFLEGSASNVGPNLLTQDFGERISRSATKPYITGVAIYDGDGDGFYDIGEGIEGVKVTVERIGSGGAREIQAHYADTSGSGGYAVPVYAGIGDYEVTFTLPDGSEKVYATTITSEGNSTAVDQAYNVKVDLILDENSTPAYTPPVYAGSTAIPDNAPTVLNFAAPTGAHDYEITLAEIDTNPLEQNAESGAPVSTDKSSSYSLIAVPSNSGDRLAFHLAHPSFSSGHQSMTLERTFVPSASAEISFDSRLRRTDSAQIASLQVTKDQEATWEDVWFQQASNSYVNSFSRVTVDVSKFEGQPIKFRFLFYLGGGDAFLKTSSSFGWHFDDIAFDGMSELTTLEKSVITESAYTFNPPSGGDYFFQVRPRFASEPDAPFGRYADGLILSADRYNYDTWSTKNESATSLPAGTLTDQSADYDGDGLSQLAEYGLEALGFDPTKPDAQKLPNAILEGDLLCLHYTVDPSLDDVSICVQVSSDLQTWHRVGEAGAPAGFTDTVDVGASGVYQNRTAAVPFGSHTILFMRLCIEGTDPAP